MSELPKQTVTVSPSADISAPAPHVLLAIAVGVLGWALSRTANSESIYLLMAAVALACIAVFAPAHQRVRGGWLIVCAVLAVGISQVLQMFVVPLRYHGGSLGQSVRQIVLLGGISALLALLSRRRGGAIALTILGTLALWWMVHIVLNPSIDVFPMAQEACRLLSEGRNPYLMRIADPYPPEYSVLFYGPGMSKDGILQFGYNYMPLSLLVAEPGYLLGHDVRLAHVAAMLVAGVLLLFARPGRSHLSAPGILLLSPAALLVTCMAWTEPVSILCLALLLFSRYRAPRLLPYAFGLLLASKQYLVLLAPLALLLIERPWSRSRLMGFAARAILVIGIVTLPLALWDIGAFTHSAITFHLQQPFRPELLSVLTRLGVPNPQNWTFLGPLLWAIFVTVVLLCALRRKCDFFVTSAAALLLFFSFSRMGALNYYFAAYAALCCALVSTSAAPDESENNRVPQG